MRANSQAVIPSTQCEESHCLTPIYRYLFLSLLIILSGIVIACLAKDLSADEKRYARDVEVIEKNNSQVRGNLQQILNQLLPTNTSVDLTNLTATGAELNVLDGISSTVTAANLNTLTGGTASDASLLHTHTSGVTADNAGLLDNLDSTQFLRSDTSDSFTSGTLTLDAGTTFNVIGTFQIVGTAVTSTAAELNKLSGTSANVTAANLDTLTGSGSTTLHSHAAPTTTLDGAYDNDSGERTVTVDGGDISFDLNDSTSDYKLVIDNTTNATIADAITLTTTSGSFTDGIDVSDGDIDNALSVGTNTILGDGSMTFDLNSSSSATLTFDNLGAGAFLMSVNGLIEQNGLGDSVMIGEGAGANEDLTTNENVFIGKNAGNLVSSGSQNVLVGKDAGLVQTTAISNTFFGHAVGDAVTASSNTFIGSAAGGANTSGGSGTFVGKGAGLVNTTGSTHTFIGYAAGDANTATTSNTFVGSNAGGAITSASQNVFVGKDAGILQTTVGSGTYLGHQAGDAANTGTSNTFIGSAAGGANTSGTPNVFVGKDAGLVNTTGGTHTFIGYAAGDANTATTSNTLVGSNAGGAITTGSQNVLIGKSAGLVMTTATTNTFIGYQAGDADTASSNTFIGSSAGGAVTSGSSNTLIGKNAGDAVTTASSMTAIGYLAGDGGNATAHTLIGANIGSGGINSTVIGSGAGSVGPGNGNVSIGYAASNAASLNDRVTVIGSNAGGSRTANDITAIGKDAGALSTSGAAVTFIGYAAGDAVTTAASCTFIGSNAGSLTTTGGSNVFIGTDAGAANTTATTSVYIGYQAGDISTGSANLFIGSGAGGVNQGGALNVFVGKDAGAANTTNQNTFVGYAAGDATTSGDDNVFVGSNAGGANTTGSPNVFVGKDAGLLNVTGSDNVFVGYQAGDANTASNNTFVGANAGGANTSGTQNTFVGKDAGLLNTTSSGNTFVGWTAGDASTGADNTFVGDNAGGGNTSGASNVMLGHDAGSQNTTTSNLLYIDNSNTETPLIGGDFTDAGEAVGINTAISTITASSHALLVGGSSDIGGTLQANFTGTETTAGACLDDAGTKPSNATFVSCSGAPSDIAEMVETTTDVESADIVVTTPRLVSFQGMKANEKKGRERFYYPIAGDSYQIAILEKSTKAYQDNVMGVISTMPVKVFGEDVGRSPQVKHPLPLALVGRVPVKVNLENGVIEPGDAITSSSMPGVGMAATKAGSVVGIALESFHGPGVGKVMMVVMNKTFHIDKKTKKFVQNLSDPKVQRTFNALFGNGEFAKLMRDPKSFSSLKTLIGLYSGLSSRKDIRRLQDVPSSLLNKLAYVAYRITRLGYRSLEDLSEKELLELLEKPFEMEETLIVKGEIAEVHRDQKENDVLAFAETATLPLLSYEGEGMLHRGVATIEFDPKFLERVTVDGDHSFHVKVTQTFQDARGLMVVEKTPKGFTVMEASGGKSNATFDWEVVAQRKKKESTEELLTYAP